MPLQRPSPIPIADIDFLLFEDAADFRCKFIQHCPNCVIVQIAGVQRQHLTRKDGNGFAVVGRIGVQTPKAGQTVILIDPLLVPGNRYFERIETLFAAVAASGVERLPAERRYTQRERSLRDGIRVSDRDGAIVQKLLACLTRTGPAHGVVSHSTKARCSAVQRRPSAPVVGSRQFRQAG